MTIAEPLTAPVETMTRNQTSTPVDDVEDDQTAATRRPRRRETKGPIVPRRPQPVNAADAGDRQGDFAKLWPPAVRPAVDFVQFGGPDLPKSSFWLRSGEMVRDVTLYFERLRGDLAAGPEGPCAKSAIRDCRTLRILFGRRKRIISQGIAGPVPPLKPR